MGKRARRGEGYIGLRPDGLWVGQLSLGRTADGKRRRVVVYGHTQKEVQDKLASEKSLAGMGVTESSQTLSEYLDYWLDVAIKPRCKPLTYLGYANDIRLYVKPEIGFVPLKKLTPVHLETLLAKLAKKKTNRGKPLTRARKHVWTVLHAALKKAVKWKLLASNPCAAVDSPVIKAPERIVWSNEEISRFLTSTKDTVFYLPYLLAIMGLRQGEIFGLHWEDVDLTKKELTVQKNLVEYGNKILGIFTPKTKAGLRVLKLPESVFAAFDQRLHPRSGPIFLTGNNTFYKKTNILWRFKRDCVDAKVRTITFHDLRHISASVLLQSGASPKDVQAQLGHATPHLVMELYGHSMDGAKEKMATMLQEVIKPKDGGDE